MVWPDSVRRAKGEVRERPGGVLRDRNHLRSGEFRDRRKTRDSHPSSRRQTGLQAAVLDEVEVPAQDVGEQPFEAHEVER